MISDSFTQRKSGRARAKERERREERHTYSGQIVMTLLFLLTIHKCLISRVFPFVTEHRPSVTSGEKKVTGICHASYTERKRRRKTAFRKKIQIMIIIID